MNLRTWSVFFGIALFAVGCKGSIGGSGAGPCEGDNPDPSCGAACAVDTDCAGGFHCGDDGACTAECSANGSGCASGQVCDDRGNCQDGDGTDGGPNDCGRIEVRAEPVIPTVQLVIDQSGSMNEDFGGLSRWDAVRQALVDPNNGAVFQLDSRVVFGATLYTSTGGNAGGVCPQLQEVAPAPNNFAAVASLLLNNNPVQDTPTAEAMNAVANNFPPADPITMAPRIIVLATDGNPDNCVDPDAHDQGSQMLSESAVQGAFTRGLETYVLSVGDQVAQTHLQRLANAGVGLALDSGMAQYYVANNASQLIDAFNEIIRGARTCTFTLNGAVQDPEGGFVELNGVPLQLGTDWVLVNESTLELIGAACDTFLNADVVELLAEFACGSVIVL